MAWVPRVMQETSFRCSPHLFFVVEIRAWMHLNIDLPMGILGVRW